MGQIYDQNIKQALKIKSNRYSYLHIYADIIDAI